MYAVYERNEWGRKKLIYTNKRNDKDSENISQLKAIVDYVRTYCAGSGIHRLPEICLPSLKTIIKTDELSYRDAGALGYFIPIGWCDDPEQQRQEIVELELSRDNIYIVGSAQMGKTTLLQTIAYGILRKYTPKQVNIYIIDCGNMALKTFENSRHVGGVVLSGEEEKCKNLFTLLNTLVVQRKKALSDRGWETLSPILRPGIGICPWWC